MLVFGRTKRGIQKLADELEHRGFKAGAIHGNKRQGQRQRILDQFKKTMEKTNSMLDDMKRITKAIADPVEHAAEFVGGLKKGAKLVELAGKLLDKKHSQKSE